MKLGFFNDIGKMFALGLTSKDKSGPIVTISSSEESPTSVNPVPITFLWSEPVYGFGTGDVTFTNGTPFELIINDLDNYIITVTPDGNGEITVQVPANGCEDASGNGNQSSDTFAITYEA